MTAPTAAARKRLERERKRAQGLVPLEVWVPADRVAAFKRWLAAFLKGDIR